MEHLNKISPFEFHYDNNHVFPSRSLVRGEGSLVTYSALLLVVEVGESVRDALDVVDNGWTTFVTGKKGNVV